MSKDPTVGMFVGDEEIERRQRKRLATPPPDTKVQGGTSRSYEVTVSGKLVRRAGSVTKN